jgi:hypothetical protein
MTPETPVYTYKPATGKMHGNAIDAVLLLYFSPFFGFIKSSIQGLQLVFPGNKFFLSK